MCITLLCMPSCAQKKNAKKAKTEAKASYTVKTLPTAVSSKILEAIEANYKGKVVMFDIWATWCPPCRAALVSIDSIKPALAKKGVKFVYITGETSPEAKWKEMIPNIAGDHYRLTAAQWKALGMEENMPGIPCYKVLNKDGSTAFSNLTEGGYPGNETMKPILQAALKKK